jgi:hypothetical protein
MTEMGHADPAMALSLYARVMQRTDAEAAALRALVEGVWANEWANEAAKAPEAQQTREL